MSDNWVILIPEDPLFVPGEPQQQQATELLRALSADADEITATTSDEVRFFDCGENFERILCPSCGCEINLEWWQDRMGEDFDQGFKLLTYSTPCCRKDHTLHELRYDWPQGFGRFALETMNSSIGMLDESQAREFETILHTTLRVIHQHI